MKKLLFFLLFLCCVQLSKAQSTENRKNKPLFINNQGIQGKSVSAENSIYYGFDNKIKEMMLDNNIPEKFPTKESYADKKSYLNVANEWLKAHQALVKPEFKNTTLKD
jgi:hypothetical protein